MSILLLFQILIFLKVLIWINFQLDIFLLAAGSNLKMNTAFLFFYQHLILKLKINLIVCFYRIAHRYALISLNQVVMHGGLAIFFFKTWFSLSTSRRFFFLEFNMFSKCNLILGTSKWFSSIFYTDIRVILMNFVRLITHCFIHLLWYHHWRLNNCRLFCYFV